MELFTEKQRRIVREEYQVLLRAEAECALPVGYEGICAFYRRTGEVCLAWAAENEGGILRRQYLSLESHTDRSRFRAYTYTLRCAPVWESETHAAFVCRSCLRGNGGEPVERMMSQVWLLSEQSMLPMRQILQLCRPHKHPHLPFRPDGVYPQDDGSLTFYKNTSGACLLCSVPGEWEKR